jgi:hypothetical protein
MEKLKNINQVLFTVLAVLLIIIVTIGLFNLSRDLSSPINYRSDKHTMLANEKVENLLEKEEYGEVISFSNFYPIEYSYDLIIIPVTQVSLSKPRKLKTSFDLNPLEMPTPKTHWNSLSSSFDFYDDNELLNNLLIYSLSDSRSYPVFNERICIAYFITYKLRSEYFIYIVATDKDSNNDGSLDDNDKMYIYIYNITQKNMNKIDSSGEHIIRTARIFDTDNLLLKIGVDKNRDGIFDPKHEPVTFKSLNLVSLSYVDFISAEMKQKLQSILSGN